MKKLLHISANQFPPLTVNHHTKKIWVELAKGFDEYHILARSFDNKRSTTTEGNITLHLIPKFGNKARSFILSSFYIFYLIPKYKITILLAQSAIFGGLPAVIAKNIFRIPLMVEIHGEEYFKFLTSSKGKHFLLKHLILFVFKHSTKVRSLNSKMTSKLKNVGVVTNVVEIPGRVDLTIFKKQKYDYSIKSSVKLISVGRFVKEKNYIKLIELLNASGVKFDLVLVGGGPLKDRYIEKSNILGVQNNVHLIDWISQEELTDLIIESDIYIQSSISEGMPRTILEAMALKMPIITTPVGSILGVIMHRKNGLIMEPNNLSSFVSNLELMINDFTLRERLASAAYEDVRAKYEWSVVFEQYRCKILEML